MSNPKRQRQRRLEREQSAIERRLAAAVGPNLGGPLLQGAPIRYEWAERDRGVAHGGIGMIARLVEVVGLASEIDASLELLKVHRPYHESDHVLNIAYNGLCGGTRLEDIETRRPDAVFLDGLGTPSLPDPTTAGDFCRRFDERSIIALQEAINRARMKVWSKQPASFFSQTARIDADASIVPTDGQCKQGMDIAYNGTWGYSALLVSLQNTGEPLYQSLHGANRPSHEGVIPLYDRSIELCRQAGFSDILLRGDTDFSLTTEFDRWDADRVRFVFGYDAKANLVQAAEAQPEDLYHELAAKAERQLATRPRTRPTNVKDEIVRERAYKTIRPKKQEVVEFSYRPRACTKDYRVVALRKNLSIERGDNVLFEEYRYFFYITNDHKRTADQVIAEAHQRCNQENLISNLKTGLRALHAPVNTLNANWAYMTMASLAWTLKAWCALMLPISPRYKAQHEQQRCRLLTMEFRTFRAAFIDIPCQIVKTARYIRWRIQAWNPSLRIFFRLLDALTFAAQ
ncbi:MAG TPA: IS1380 family transposase [Solirubrobacteraceae bacterium]|nr:IS1380 family transposase [Solirubrobacteraceae bacterium]